MKFIIEALGWLAAALILLAYALISSGKLQPRSTAYQLLNIGGAIGFIVNSGWNGAIPSAALNIVWLIIGLTTLVRRKPAAATSKPAVTGSAPACDPTPRP